MVSGYFGVPGCGKTTILTAIAQKELIKISKGKSSYKHVLTNFYCKGCERIDFSDMAVYNITDSLILLDEITLDADSRDFKQFSAGLKEFFTLHRHVYNDIVYFCQDFSRVDKTIRNVTYDLWYVTKTVIPFFNRWSVARQIYRNIDINEYSSELVLGYRFAKFTEVIFGRPKKIIYRPHWYPYFDSFDAMGLDQRDPFQYVSWDPVDFNFPID